MELTCLENLKTWGPDKPMAVFWVAADVLARIPRPSQAMQQP